DRPHDGDDEADAREDLLQIERRLLRRRGIGLREVPKLLLHRGDALLLFFPPPGISQRVLFGLFRHGMRLPRCALACKPRVSHLAAHLTDHLAAHWVGGAPLGDMAGLAESSGLLAMAISL